jgi:hypothetical protein
MITYKLINSRTPDGVFGDAVAVLRSDGWTIPFDPANTDYQAYLKWLEEGNTPEPAENT